MEKRNNRIKDFIKSFLLNNLGYKVLSLVIAVMVWLVIINIADPVTTRTFSGLEVEIKNQSAITSINQVYEIIEGRTVDFTVKGKASVVKNLKLTDFIAYADLSKLSRVYAAEITVKCDKNEDIEVDSGNQMLVVKLENVDKKNIQVSVEAKGDVADGYYVGDFEIKPNMITVSGGESKIKNLDTVKIIVDVAGAKKDFTQKVQPIAYDKDGSIIDSSYLTFSNSGSPINDISVNVTVYNTKTVPVVLDVSGTPAENYVYEGDYEYSPETLVVGGSTRKLSKIDSLVIPVDITDATGINYETSVFLSDYLPDGVKPVNEEEKVAVRITLEPVISKTLDIPVTDVAFKNISDDTTVTYANSNDLVSIELRGTAEQLGKFSTDSVEAYIDLKDAKKGNCYLQVQFSKLPSEYIVSESKLINVFVADSKGLGVKDTANPEINVTDAPPVTASPETPDTVPAPDTNASDTVQ